MLERDFFMKIEGNGKLKFQILSILLFSSCLFFFSSCSNTKYIGKDQSLLVKNKLDLIDDNLNHAELEDIKNNLKSSSIIKQKPNTKTLNLLRLKLWLYNKNYNDKKTGKIWNWLLIDKNMEPPVIYDSTLAMKTAKNMVSFLKNQGFFYATADYTSKTKHQKTKVDYKVNTGKVFLIDSISYDISDTSIRKAMMEATDQSFIKEGAPFKVASLIKERDRLTKVVKDAGYFHFSNRNIRFVLDTINKSIFGNVFDPFSNLSRVKTQKEQEQPKLDLNIKLLKQDDSAELHPYYIRHIYVYPDYTAYGIRDSSKYKKELYKGLEIRYQSMTLRPRVLRRSIFLEENELFSKEDQNNTIQRLNSLGVWKFVNVEMDTVRNAKDSLDCYIFLIPGKKQEIGANIETTTSAGDYIVGGALNLNYQHNNTNRAANQFSINLKGGMEWNDDASGHLFVQANEISVESQVSFPRFVVPFHLGGNAVFTHPQTTISLGFNDLQRLNFFSWASFKGSFSYSWNETPLKQWIVTPIFLNYNNIYNISSGFKSQLENNPFLKNSFSSIFIEGENVSFIFNDQKSGQQSDVNFFRGNFEESGLLLGALNRMTTSVFSEESTLGKLAAVKYSNYIKASAEYKHYFNRPHATLVTRVYAGVGVPYGKSDVLPYIKQFTAGGPNSLRAWRLRALGPGSYYNPDANDPDIFPDQTGEMKLEGNVEYRFDMFSMFDGFLSLKGALFVDAGNIWNLHENTNKPGAEFKLGRLYQDIAVGSGVGLRLDFSYAILRLDVATPLKIPYESKNYGWDLSHIRPFSKTWRRRNLIFNFAVGYPF